MDGVKVLKNTGRDEGKIIIHSVDKTKTWASKL